MQKISVSNVQKATLHPLAESPRVLVTVYFDGPLPPIVGYWTMN
jgi:hypothetical protein